MIKTFKAHVFYLFVISCDCNFTKKLGCFFHLFSYFSIEIKKEMVIKIMNKIRRIHFIIIAFLLLIFSLHSCGQSESLRLVIKNHPGGNVKLVKFIGDKMVSVKDKKYDKGVTFNMEDQRPGMYRIIIKEAKNRRQQTKAINFIYNNENIKLETSYNAPQKDLQVIRSEENRIYRDFLSYQRTFERKMELLNRMIDQYPKEDPFYEKVMKKYGKVQKAHEAH